MLKNLAGDFTLSVQGVHGDDAAGQFQQKSVSSKVGSAVISLLLPSTVVEVKHKPC